MASAEITVGRHLLSLDEARTIIEMYTGGIDERRTKADFYAWPYYDHLDTGATPSDLNDGDLLAPVLLNVDPGIHGFASLQRIRPTLQGLLDAVPEDMGLGSEEATPDVLDRVAELFSVLDNGKVLGVGGTTLSKVLHRKRPELIPLRDRFVHDAYVPDRMEPSPERTWVEYFRLLLVEMQADLRANPTGWQSLTQIPSGGGLTPLRALDIIAWRKGKRGR